MVVPAPIRPASTKTLPARERGSLTTAQTSAISMLMSERMRAAQATYSCPCSFAIPDDLQNNAEKRVLAAVPLVEHVFQGEGR